MTLALSGARTDNHCGATAASTHPLERGVAPHSHWEAPITNELQGAPQTADRAARAEPEAPDRRSTIAAPEPGSSLGLLHALLLQRQRVALGGAAVSEAYGALRYEGDAFGLLRTIVRRPFLVSGQTVVNGRNSRS